MAQVRSSLSGRWRILSTELWDRSELDEVGEAHLTLGKKNVGEFAFLCISADIDYRLVERDGLPAAEFSFDGFDELTPVSGRGWAILHGEELRGRIFFHLGDDSGFVAKRKVTKTRGRRLTRRCS
jgi:hypothetical protein